MKKQENKTKKGVENRPQVGSGPSNSDSPSDNVNSSITSSPTDTLRASKNSGAKVIKNLIPILSNIKKFKNNDFCINYSNFLLKKGTGQIVWRKRVGRRKNFRGHCECPYPGLRPPLPHGRGIVPRRHGGAVARNKKRPRVLPPFTPWGGGRGWCDAWNRRLLHSSVA